MSYDKQTDVDVDKEVVAVVKVVAVNGALGSRSWAYIFLIAYSLSDVAGIITIIKLRYARRSIYVRHLGMFFGAR